MNEMALLDIPLTIRPHCLEDFSVALGSLEKIGNAVLVVVVFPLSLTNWQARWSKADRKLCAISPTMTPKSSGGCFDMRTRTILYP